MVQPAYSLPGMLETLKDQVGAVQQSAIEIKEYSSRVAVRADRMLLDIEDQRCIILSEI